MSSPTPPSPSPGRDTTPGPTVRDTTTPGPTVRDVTAPGLRVRDTTAAGRTARDMIAPGLTVRVVGRGDRAAEWATRFLATANDVFVDDASIAARVAELWPSADRLGLFPGASLDRLTVGPPASSTPVDVLQITDHDPDPAPDHDHDHDTALPARTQPAPVESAPVESAPAEPAPVESAPVESAPAEPAPAKSSAAESARATGPTVTATEASARGCSPIHLVPLVEVSGPDAERLAALYHSMGMTPVSSDASPGRAALVRSLGPALVEVTGGDPDALIAVLRALRATGTGAGEAVARLEALRLAAGAAERWAPGVVPAAPLRLYRTPVEPDWVDYNGHMTESAYLTAAGWASDALFRYIGDDEAYREAGHSFYTVETHVHYVQEVAVHEPIEFTTQLLGVDAKRVHLVHEMFHGVSGDLLCSVEQMLVHVDMAAGRSCPILPDVAAALAAIATAHADLPVPDRVGSVMRLPPPRPPAT